MKDTNAENELIASFMGFKYYPHPLVDSGWRKEKGHLKIPTYYLCRVTKDMRYKTSWDWLMPVVEKIEGLGYQVDIDGYVCEIIKAERNCILYKKPSKILSTHKAVTDFITWYNLNSNTSC